MNREETNAVLGDLLKLTHDDFTPNINELWMLLKDFNCIKLNIKNMGYDIARHLQKKLAERPIPVVPSVINLVSKACTQSDIESDWFLYWNKQLNAAPIYHRKLWEFAFVLQALFEFNLLGEGHKGFGFGCGQEPLPSYFASKGIEAIVTDLEPEKSAGLGWVETGQHTTSKDQAFYSDLVSREKFDQYCSHRYVDMNNVPVIDAQFDFCWSICSLEHLGSIKNGLDFIVNSLSVLKPGGIAVHTTEFNYLSEYKTIDNWPTVLFTKKDFLNLKSRVECDGHKLLGPDFTIGNGVLDKFIDIPPYSVGEGWLSREQWSDNEAAAHLRLSVDGFPSTCFGIIIQKAI